MHSNHSMEVVALEQTLGLAVPAAYRDWLLRGRPWDPTRCMLSKAPSGRRSHWIKVNRPHRAALGTDAYEVSVESMLRLNRQYRDGDGRIPTDAIEIADADTTERILLYVQGSRSGQVWLKEWHLLECQGIDSPEADMSILAVDYSAFLASLIDHPLP